MSNPKKNIENIRVDYNKSIIDYNQMPDSPFELFKLWLDKAILVDNDNILLVFINKQTIIKNNVSLEG